MPNVWNRGTVERAYRRVTPGAAAPARADVVAVEEPLDIRLAGETIAITMRTPGADHALAAGFLLSEGIIRSVDDLGTLSHCGRTDASDDRNVHMPSASPRSIASSTSLVPR